MKKVVHQYTFNAATRTIICEELTNLNKLALITNVTDNVIIYNFADPAKGGTLSGDTLTLTYDTTSMSNSDNLQIIIHTGTDLERIGFTKAISGDVDTEFFTLLRTGSGMTVNQTGGELVITTGTTARAETIIRSTQSFVGGIRARIASRLSQRIINQNFIYEMVDVIGDGLAYTINSATSITVTFPASYGLSSQDVGRSVTLQQFSGTGTFLSGRYAIASVAGNNATITVSGFAVGSGTVSVVGLNFYRLLYDGTTATAASFDVGRGGYAWTQKPGGTNTAAITTLTTAAPGHQFIFTANDGVAAMQDQLTANATTVTLNDRGQRITNIPDDIALYIQIRAINLGTAPASTTTWNIEQVSVAYFEAESVVVQDMRPVNYANALPVRPIGSTTVTGAVTVSGTLTAATTAPPTLVADITSAAISTTATTAATTPSWGTSYQINIAVTATTGTSPTMIVEVQESDDTGTNWYTRYTFPTIIATGSYRSPILKLRGNRVRYVQTIGGGSPSFTRSLNRIQRQDTSVAGVPGKLISAASTNSTLLRAGNCELASLSVTNTNASARYLKIYDKATAPTVGTDTPVQVFMIPGATAGSGSNPTISVPINFALGCGIGLTTGATDADTGAVAANEIIVNYSLA